jgi:hypothetical protein
LAASKSLAILARAALEAAELKFSVYSVSFWAEAAAAPTMSDQVRLPTSAIFRIVVTASSLFDVLVWLVL